MITTADHTDLGLLLSYALQPTQRPGRNPEYRRVLARYRTEVDFRTALDAVLVGLDAKVLSDSELGFVLGIEAKSPFAFRYTDMSRTETREGRLLAGLTLVGIAAWAYPTPADLEDDRIRRVPDVDFESWLRATCGRLRNTDAAGEVIPDQGLDAAWRIYVNLPSTRVGDRGAGAGRLSPKCTLYWVRNVLGWLTEQGMARADTTGSENTWTLTERFRAHVKDMAGGRAYTYLAARGRADDDAPAPEEFA
jgi:hypothetical protein